MKLNTEILSTIFLMIVCSGNVCTCRKSPPKPQYVMSQEFKDYTLFKNGSWWVYNRANSTDTDTMTVIKRDVEIADPSYISYKWEQYLLHLKSTYYKNDTIILLGDVSSPLDFDTDYSRYLYSTSFSSFLITFFSNKPLKYRLSLYDNMETEYREFHNSITLNGITYNNVKVFEIFSRVPIDQRLPRVIHYAKNIGIVRKELWNGQVWNLVKQNVVQ